MTKTDIWVSFNYGGWSLTFKRRFYLPFVPFYNMGLCFDSEKEYSIRLENNEYLTTHIDYSIDKANFCVFIDECWKQPVSDETIDDVLNMYSSWQRIDNTDDKELKELMKRNSEQRN